MKVNSAPQKEEPAASALRTLILSAKKWSDGSGSPPKKYAKLDYISNSYLSMIAKELAGEHQFFGNEHFLKFGNELHKRDLKPKEKKSRLEKDQETLLKSMLDTLKASTYWTKAKRGAILEKVYVEPIVLHTNTKLVYGITGVSAHENTETQHVKVILDVYKPKEFKATDLKTTSCTTEDAFLKAARKYRYFKQAWLYSEAKNVIDFEFFGISKKTKNGEHPTFVLPVNDFPHDLQEGEDQARILIDVYRSLKKLYTY